MAYSCIGQGRWLARDNDDPSLAHSDCRSSSDVHDRVCEIDISCSIEGCRSTLLLWRRKTLRWGGGSRRIAMTERRVQVNIEFEKLGKVFHTLLIGDPGSRKTAVV